MRFRLIKASECFSKSTMITVEPKTAEDIINISKSFGAPVILRTEGDFPEIEIYDDWRE